MTKEQENLYLNNIWCGMCNFYGAISGEATCSKCPFKDDSEMCYDSQDYSYEKFGNFIKGIKLSK